MVTTTCLRTDSTMRWTRAWSWRWQPVTAAPGQARLSHPVAGARSSRSARAQTDISSASRSRIRLAVEQQSVRRWVTFRRCQERRSISSTRIPPAARASTPAPPASWRSLTAGVALSARKYATRSRPVRSVCLSLTTSRATRPPWQRMAAAAMLLGLNPSWSAAQVKSALVNHADLVIKDAFTALHDIGPTAQGAGRENLSVAADATTWMDPVSASFGKVTVGHPTSLTITLYNPTGSSQTFSVSTTKFTPDTFGGTVPSIYDAGTLSAGDSRITVPSSVTVPANGSTTLTVSVNAAHGDVVQGWINL